MLASIKAMKDHVHAKICDVIIKKKRYPNNAIFWLLCLALKSLTNWDDLSKKGILIKRSTLTKGSSQKTKFMEESVSVFICSYDMWHR